MITLYGFGSRFGVEDLSPFVLKVDAFMRMADIPFQVRGSFANLRTAPKGKLPYIVDNGKTISDSTFIIRYLTEHYAADIDRHLTDEQRACARMVMRTLDESLYWCLVHSRWIRDDSWQIVKPAFFSKMPFPICYIAPVIARRNIRKALYLQGTGRHSDEEILAIADEILQDLSVLLGEKRWFFGDRFLPWMLWHLVFWLRSHC